MSKRIQRRPWQRILSYVLIGAALSQNTVWAEVSGGIATDGTMGAAQLLNGVNVTVPQSLGITSGNNLFHSFAEFNIADGQTVEFTGSNALQNVISRVTGTDVTEIEGTLKSSIANAAFYFINPNGVSFGANGHVDVSGAFHVSTADKIDFPNNGAAFYANSNQVSTLSSDAPAAFGFLGASAANNGLINVNGSHLAVGTGQTLDMAAGGITIENGAAITASAGQVRLTAVQREGLAALDDKQSLAAETPSASNAGHIVVNASAVDTTGVGGGRVALWGGNVRFTDSTLYANNSGATDAASTKGIDVRAYSLGINKALVAFDALAAGKAGNVAINAGTLDITNGGAIRSSSWSQGSAGNVSVTADRLSIDNQAMAVVTGIVSRAEKASSGQAGKVTVQAGTLDIFNGGVISTSTYGQGDAGNVSVTADTLKIDDQTGSPVATGIVSQAYQGSSGRAGNVAVNAATFDIRNGGVVSSRTAAHGDGGSVAVTAGTLAVLNGGLFSSSTFAQGNAGNVTVMADILRIDNLDNSPERATGITSRANKGSSGQAGNVTVQAETLYIGNDGVVSSDTYAQGSAGNVTVMAGKVGVFGDGYISSGSWGIDSSGKTGNVTVMADDWLHLAGGGHISIENEANAFAATLIQPSFITITTPDIEMIDSEITSNATGNVAAGNIAVNLSRGLSMDLSFISTTANTGDGGVITINGGEFMYLQDSGFKTTVSGANSNGGDIFTSANTLVMNTGVIQANAVGGSGGNITLKLGSLIPSGNTLIKEGSAMDWRPFEAGFNVIQAASQAGVSGAVNVTAPQLNLSGIIANLGGPQFDTSIISQDYCGVGIGSSLTRKGFGGLKPKSGEQLVF